RSGLAFIILLLRLRVHVEPLVIPDIVDQSVGGDRVGGLHQGRAEYLQTLEIGTDLVEITPDFTALLAIGGVHHADHIPLAAAKFYLLAERRFWVSGRDRLPYHDFTLPLVEPAAGDDVHVVPHFDPSRRQSAHRNVDALLCFGASEIDDRYDF